MNWRNGIVKKKFYFTETLPVCRNMKKSDVGKDSSCLKDGENEVFVDDALREESKNLWREC